MSAPEPPVDRSRSAGSRLLYGADTWASRPVTALIVLAADLACVLLSLAVGFPGRWETVFQTLVAALTLAMVFVIQARQQAATQRKLDEILQALPGASAVAGARLRRRAAGQRPDAPRNQAGCPGRAIRPGPAGLSNARKQPGGHRQDPRRTARPDPAPRPGQEPAAARPQAEGRPPLGNLAAPLAEGAIIVMTLRSWPPAQAARAAGGRTSFPLPQSSPLGPQRTASTGADWRASARRFRAWARRSALALRPGAAQCNRMRPSAGVAGAPCRETALSHAELAWLTRPE